ncbi:hypothetical protein [Sphingobium chlorophenolicum]|uniref:Uncharacterized protein n=1 Tax=Sphingobium chlorophenolicum TaxID=46429 RepID=A0A081RGN9_SPHCR|nr:hypothetical protein [Sphingobium chlorophenolicum]KEQ54362.1 hypothetical protein BV95_01427 [Sphingobium chlorophenolicum]
MFGLFTGTHIEERGNDIAVIANKLIVVALRLAKPSRFSVLKWASLLLLLPFVLLFLLLAHFSLALGLGSKDDSLGYAITATK